MPTHHSARIWAVLGASGTGKGLWIKGKLRELAPARLLIVDPMDEYGAHAARANLPAIVRAMAGPRWRLRWVPTGLDEKARAAGFALACRAALAATDCCLVVEELSLWTQPAWAPPGWRDCCNTGRHRGLHLIGASQYPAQVDKAFLASATLIHCGALRNARHRAAVAAEMDIDPAELRDLPPLHWIERDNTSGAITRGKVKAPRQRAAGPAPAPLGDASATARGKGAAPAPEATGEPLARP